MQARILVVDDATDHQLMISSAFSNRYQITSALTLHDAERALEKGTFDLILLDVSLPDGDGLSFLAKLRSQDFTSSIPVMFVTSAGEVPKEVMGLSLGAEDYIVKPIEPARLRARIEARLRQVETRKDEETVLKIGNLKLMITLQRVVIMRDGLEQQVDLTRMEFKLLFHFLKHEDQVFTREQLLSAVWGNASEVFDRTVDAHVSNLRKKIKSDDFQIQSVHGTGYRFSRAAKP